MRIRFVTVIALASVLFLTFNVNDAVSATPAGVDFAYDKEFSDGSESKVQGNVQAIPPGIADAFTVETWLYVESYTTDWMTISAQNQDKTCCGDRLWFGISGTTSSFATKRAFHVGTGVATINSNPVDTDMPESTWNHVALTLGATGTDNLKIYINGDLFHTDTLTRSNTGISKGGFAIGTSTAGHYRFDGRFDNFKIWNSILTQTQIQESRFAYGTVGVSGTPSLRAFYDFDEGTGSTVNDRTGNGFGLAITNTLGTTQDAFLSATRPKAIAYDNQGATTTQSGGSTTFNNGSTITAIPTTPPQRTSFTFAGWFTAASGGTPIISGSAMPNNREATVKLYAQWTTFSIGNIFETKIIDGGSGTVTADCRTLGPSTVIFSITGSSVQYAGAPTVTNVYGNCASLTQEGLALNALSHQLGRFGAFTGTGPVEASCFSAGAQNVVVGARVFRTPSGFVAGITPYCGQLPTGSSSFLLTGTNSLVGTSTGVSADVICSTGYVVTGMSHRVGDIMDAFGIRCAAITGVSQSTLSVTTATNSKSYPYSITPSFSTSGGSGAGAVSYAVSGGDAPSCAVSNNTASAIVTASSPGTCIIRASKASDLNYAITTSEVTLTFTKANLTITASSHTVTFGSSPPTITPGYSGFVNSENSSSASFTSGLVVPTCSTSYTSTSSVSLSPIATTCSGGSSANYTFSGYVSGSITINRAVQSSLSLSSISGVFLSNLRLTTSGGSDTGTVSFAVSSAGTAGCSIVNSESLTSTTAGSCQIVATKLGTTNFLPAFDTQTVTISKATLVLTTSVGATLKYGSTATASFSSNRSVGVSPIPAISGALTFETSTSTACNINSGSGVVTMNRASGTCSIRVRLINDTNFQDTSSALVSITPAQADAISVTAVNRGSVFTGSAAAITPGFTVTGLQFSDTVTVTYLYVGTSNAGNVISSATIPSAAGSYSIIPTVSLTNSDSYTAAATTSGGTLTISRAPRSVNPSTFSKLNLKYGESATVISNATSPSTNNDGEFTYAVGSGCTNNSGTITAANYFGNCSVTTTIQQGFNYESATASAVSFSLSKADTITVTASSPAAVTFTGSAAVVTPTVSVTGLVAGNSATGATFNFGRSASGASVSSYGPSATAPTNAGLYEITPTSLALAGGITTDFYVATIFETATLTINKANQSIFSNYGNLSAILGSGFLIYPFGGSGDGAVSLAVANGTASGCSTTSLAVTASSAGTCLLTVNKATSENFNSAQASFGITFFYFVPAPAAPVSTRQTEIAIATAVPFSATATAAPKITSISPATGPVGTVITITGTGLNGVSSVRIGRRALTSVTGVDSTSVTAVIPAGATTGPIVLSNSFGSDFIASGFTVTP